MAGSRQFLLLCVAIVIVILVAINGHNSYLVQGAISTGMRQEFPKQGITNATKNTTVTRNDATQPIDATTHTHLSCNQINLAVNESFQWQRGQKVLLVGLPKAGTTSVSSFFRAAGMKVCDYWCPDKVHTGVVAKCIERAINSSRPPLKTCGDYDMYGQMDLTMDKGFCFLPQIQALDELHKEHPDAVFILNQRNIVHWVRSVKNWKGMRTPMDVRMAGCAAGPTSPNATNLAQWYCDHVQRIRQFVNDHPTHTLIELDIESNATGKRLADFFGLNESNWKHQNQNAALKNKNKDK
jgi:hypothetical protein